jgi:hypothetical protein
VIKLLSRAACAVLVVAAAAAAAQTPPAERDELEPGVNTSAPASAPPSAPPGEPRAQSTAEPPARPAPAAGVPARTLPADGTSAATPNKPAGRSNARDRLDLDATQITGNRELPKVLYIVPWRGAELGDLVGRPVNSLLDEVLEPVDRDVFRRQNRYFEALQPNEAAPASKPEK